MRSLYSIGSKQLRHRAGRSVLTAAGIVLGVAILFGVLVSNATTQTGVDRLVADFTGRADVVVTPTGTFDATMPGDVLDDLSRLRDVEAAVPGLNFRSAIDSDAVPEPVEISLRGIEPESAPLIQDFRLLRGRSFVSGEREIVIPQRLAAKLDVEVGTAVGVATQNGVRRTRLVGILDDAGAGRTNQGDVAFTSLAFSRALRRVGPGTISQVRIILTDGLDVDDWIRAHRDDAGPGLDFENASTLAEGFKDFLGVLGAVFTFFAGIALFVGAFLIYLTLSMAVIERTRTYGTMRALGATRGQVRRVVIAEAIALGVVSTVVGLLLGLAIARGLLVLMASLFEIDLPGLTIRTPAVIAAVAIGLWTTLVSSLVPARRAARLSPVEAMRGDHARDTRLGRAWIAGAVALPTGVATTLAGGNAGAAGTPLILLGAVLLTPLLLRPLASFLGRVTNRIARGVGDIAVLHLVRERSRSAYTLALIMVVMSMIFAIGGLNTTMTRLFDEALDREFGSDIQIAAPGALAPEFETELRAIAGVSDAVPVRFAAAFRLTGEDQDLVFARIIEPNSYFRLASFRFDEGNEDVARRALNEGGAVLAPSSLVADLQTAAGGRTARVRPPLRLRTNSGPRDFRVAATYTSIGGPPEVVIGLHDGQRYFNADGANAFLVSVRDGTDVGKVRAAIKRDLAPRYNVEVSTAASLKEEARDQFDRFFMIFYAILLVAAVVGLLGLANTLAMSVLQRYREIGILRAIGTTRGQVRRMVLVESATLGLVAFALSIPLGLLMSVLTVRGIGEAFQMNITYVYPSSWVPIVAAFGIAVAVIAALAPGRRAARLEVISALQYE